MLFIENANGASVIGIEYIVCGKLFASLLDEKRYWHPHIH